MGLLAGRLAAAEALGRPLAPPPPTTALGALVAHVTGGAEAAAFQPMNVNFGLFPPLDAVRGGRKGGGGSGTRATRTGRRRISRPG